MSQLFLSIIVCTHEREDLLTECIASLQNQNISPESYEIIIVNNTTHNKLQAQDFTIDKNTSLRIIHEKKIGLSRARNRGLAEAKASWVAYIDDDAKAERNWVKRAIFIIQNYDFDCFGGIYIPWWKYKRPRWLAEGYGSKKKLCSSISEIQTGYNWGSNIFFNKDILLKCNGFSESLGMRGKKIAYAEETAVQAIMRQKGYKIAFDPELIIYHLVNKQKLKVSWHIKAAFADARDQKQSFPEEYTSKNMLKTSFFAVISPLTGIGKWMKISPYYYENFVLHVGSFWARLAGKIFAILN